MLRDVLLLCPNLIRAAGIHTCRTGQDSIYGNYLPDPQEIPVWPGYVISDIASLWKSLEAMPCVL